MKSFYDQAKELFPNSRDLTKEESEALAKGLKEISEPVTEDIYLWKIKSKLPIQIPCNIYNC